VRLVALRPIQHAVGAVAAGEAFIGGQEFIDSGAAVLEADYRPSWNGVAWPGATVVCIASGPSLTSAQCEAVRQWRNARWRMYHDEASRAFAGEFWTQDEELFGSGYGMLRYSAVRLIASEKAPGLSRRPGVIHQGQNSGYQVVGLAHQAGAHRIVLLGYDMHDRGGSHWHGNHPPGLHSLPSFDEWLVNFQVLARDLDSEGIEVINCTPGSALSCFKQSELTEVL
jgi:hypothetical protein